MASVTGESAVFGLLKTLWLFTVDDFDTFVIPNTAFGVFSALSGRLVEQPTPIHSIVSRLPLVLLFNWTNLLVFDLANQRLAESIREDAVNKPWRPLPAGRATPRHARHLLLAAMPATLAAAWALGVWRESALLFVLTWTYNDLGAGDDDWLLRNANIALAFYLYNVGSLRVAAGDGPDGITGAGYRWTSVVSCVILCTMQVQDLKDVQGDRLRGRRTAPLVLGQTAARWTIAVPVLVWSVFCLRFWDIELWHPWAVLLLAGGGRVAYRAVSKSGPVDDRRTWKLWCLWTAMLYALPLVADRMRW